MTIMGQGELAQTGKCHLSNPAVRGWINLKAKTANRWDSFGTRGNKPATSTSQIYSTACFQNGWLRHLLDKKRILLTLSHLSEREHSPEQIGPMCLKGGHIYSATQITQDWIMQPADVIEARNPVYTCWSKLMMKNNVNRPRNRRNLQVKPPS